jgi:hypothetical protein
MLRDGALAVRIGLWIAGLVIVATTIASARVDVVTDVVIAVVTTPVISSIVSAVVTTITTAVTTITCAVVPSNAVVTEQPNVLVVRLARERQQDQHGHSRAFR